MAYLLNTNGIDKTAVDHTPYPMDSGVVDTYLTWPVYIQNLGTGCYRLYTLNNVLKIDMSATVFFKLSEQSLSGYTPGMFLQFGFLIAVSNFTNNYFAVYNGYTNANTDLALKLPNGVLSSAGSTGISFDIILTPSS